jgi:hypothetical protein
MSLLAFGLHVTGRRSTTDRSEHPMTERDTDKRAADVGSDSLAQPAQSSGRSGPGPEPSARKGYEAGEAPSDQGEGDPSPDSVRDTDSLHGHQRQSGSRSAGEARGEDEATVHEK